MKKSNKALATAIVLVAGSALGYFVRNMLRDRRMKMNARREGHASARQPERHLTTVFSRAKELNGPAISNN